MLLKQIKFQKKEEKRKKKRSDSLRCAEALKYNRRIYVGDRIPAGENGYKRRYPVPEEG